MGEALVEAHTASSLPAPNTGVPHLTDEEVIQVLRWNAEGFTQEQIAAKLEPPRTQPTISRCLREFSLDTTNEAKRIFRAGAASAALKILREGKPKDLIQVQKGLGVLEEQQQQGLVIQIGGGQGDVKVAVMATFAPQRSTLSADTHSLSEDLGSDNQDYVVTTKATR